MENKLKLCYLFSLVKTFVDDLKGLFIFEHRLRGLMSEMNLDFEKVERHFTFYLGTRIPENVFLVLWDVSKNNTTYKSNFMFNINCRVENEAINVIGDDIALWVNKL